METSTGAQQDSRYPAARLNENGCLQVRGGDALTSFPILKVGAALSIGGS
jgi:hypothetical protein